MAPTTEPLKQEALDAIAKLPDDVGIDEIMYRLYVLDKIRKGREDVAKGHVTSAEDVSREIDAW
jgi:predicted transcriptional regulator